LRYAGAKFKKRRISMTIYCQDSKKPATLENVAATLQKSTEEKITTEQLEQRLQELEKTGIINSSVYSQNDEPIQTWKT
jgi:DNA-binding HxlR family transcriptional regulator